MVTHEAAPTNQSTEASLPVIPKSEKLFEGDINDVVITVQQITGFEITPEWWENEVGNGGPTEDILKRFDTAFEKFVYSQMGIEDDEAADAAVEQVTPGEIIAEAETELAEFDARIDEIGDDTQAKPDFIDDLAVHLKEKYFVVDSDLQAWHQYTGYDEQYRIRNEERARTGKIQVVKAAGGDITAIASINVDPATGEAINGHDMRPEAQSHKDTEAVWRDYIAKTNPEERFVIYEGEKDQSETRDQAITERSDSGLLQLLARESRVPSEFVVSGDPSVEMTRVELEQRGFSPEDVRLYELIRHVSHDPTHESPDLNLELYGDAALVGIDGFTVLTGEQKQGLITQEGAVEQLRSEAVTLAKALNERLEQLGLPKFNISEAGDIVLGDDELEALNSAWDPRSEGLLADIQRAYLEIRDKHLFDQVMLARVEGKKPFIVYGGSHITALEPALEKLV